MNVQTLKEGEMVEEFEVKTATEEIPCCWCENVIKPGDLYTKGRFIHGEDKT